MAVIEGVGDEVTLLFGLLLVGLVLVLAWLSTHTAELHAEPAPSSAGSAPTTPPASQDAAAVPAGTAHTLADSLAPPLGDEAKAEADGEGRRQSLAGDGPVDSGTASSSSSSPPDGSSPAAAPPDPAAAAAPEVQRNMVLRLKFLNDTERTAQVTPQDTIGYIKRTYFSGQEQCVRLIYQGQLLQDDGQSLASLNLTHNAVLHCYVSQRAARTGAGAGGAGPGGVGGGVGVASEQVLNVGSLMVPVFVVMLAVLWYCHVQYRHVFTAPATASLMGITVFFSFVAFGVYRR